MLIELDEFDIRMFKRAEKLIGKTKTIKANEKVYVSYDELTNIIDYLVDELEETKDKFSDYVRNVDENYKWVGDRYGI